MALPAGRYGVTIEQLRKIRKLPVNTIEMINDTQGGTARVENGAKPEAAINAGEQFWHGSILYTATVDIATTDSIVTSGEGANCTPSETITDQLADKLDNYASDPTQWDTTPTQNSTKPVTSGGEYNTAVGGYQLVKDTVGYTSKNLWNTNAFSTTSSSVGVIATLDTDKSILITGGNTGSGNNIITCGNIYLEAGDYILSGANGGSDAICLQVYSGSLSIDARDKGSGVAFTVTTAGTYRLAIYFTGSAQGLNLHFYPMIRRADIIDPTYEPYHASVSQQKADNSVIAPVEDGTNASQAYALNDLFIRDGHLCKTTTAMAQGDAVSGKYAVTSVAEILTAFLNS